MQRNYKLKHAVTAALSLMAFGFHSASFAIGLSDIDVKSNLGQPLKAQVNVLGASDLKGSPCLRLGPNSDLSHANFTLGPLSGNTAKLTITSNKIINDPIVNLSVIAGCDSSIQRDYVLLLDPPLLASTNNLETSAIEAPVIAGKVDTAVETSTTANSQPAKPKTKRVIKKSAVSQKKATKRSKKVKVTAKKSTGITADATLTKTTALEPVDTQPRLTISGGSYTAAFVSTTGLRLDKQLRFTPDPSAAATIEKMAIEDEVTVMNKRLAHLQTQITTLQEQNNKLKSENQLKSVQLTQAGSFSLGSILPFIGTGILFFAGYIAYNWFRRRQTLLQTHQTDAIWVSTDAKENNDEVVATPTEEKLFEEVNFDINNSTEDNQLVPKSMESTFESTKTEAQPIVLEDEEQFSVLDHADVFLSHGRATLAIQLLQNHLLEHPKQSITIWLFLLDLLAKENLQKLYEQTTEDCKLHFNVKVPTFSKPESTSNESLEDFPRLAEGLQTVWNTPAAVTYLDDLIYNNRLEPRAGLAKNLIEELVLLRSMAQENVNSAEVIQLDQKKLAINEQKEALLVTRKAEKMKEMAEAERAVKEKVKKEAEAEKNETDFEFTLVEKF